MSKRAFKTAASSGKATGFGTFGSTGDQTSSTLSFIQPPLDLNGIPDPVLVVIFKNLSKKDSTTKLKALDDLIARLESHGEVEDGLLDAWVRVFPRLSIENERRLRQSTYLLHGKICSVAGKRLAKHMPRIAGPWFASHYDNDRSVARAAQDALTLVFTDAEKRGNIRKVFLQQILDFCADTILHESVGTLSDERTVSKDDAENTYARVISSTIALLISLINIPLPKEDLFQTILVKQTFELANHADASIRRSVHALTRAVIQKLPGMIIEQLQDLSEIYVYKGLKADQSGSSLQFVQALQDLTTHHPTAWTEAYTGKKPAISRLEYFLKQGSQNGPADFWPALARLTAAIPQYIVSESAIEILHSIRKGLSGRHEKFQAREAWQAYVSIVHTSLNLSSEERRRAVLDTAVTPLMKQYFHPAADSEWTITGDQGQVIAAFMRLPDIELSLHNLLPQMVDEMLEQMKLSLPEQSKDHHVSQTHVAAMGERWSAIQPKLLSGSGVASSQLRELLISQDKRLTESAFEIVTTRGGKPFGSAAVVDSLLRDCGAALTSEPGFEALGADFVRQHLATIAFSPSARYLVRTLTCLSNGSNFAAILEQHLHAILGAEVRRDSKIAYLNILFSQKLPKTAFELAQQTIPLQDMLLEDASALSDTESRTLSRSISLGIMSKATQLAAVGKLNLALRQQDTTMRALKILDDLALTHSDVLLTLDSDLDTGDRLLANTLRLTEDPDEDIARLANDLSSKLSVTSGAPQAQRLGIIRQALETANENSPSVESLLDLANKLLGADFALIDALNCLPAPKTLRDDILKHICAPDLSLSICRGFAGAIHLVQDDHEKELAPISYDHVGLSLTMRSAVFFSRLLPQLNEKIGHETARGDFLELVGLMTMTIAMTEDKLSATGSNQLWDDSLEAEEAAVELTTEGLRAVQELVQQLSQKDIQELWNMIPSAYSAWAYYRAVTFGRIAAMRPDLTAPSQVRPNIGEGELFKTLAAILGQQQHPELTQTLLKSSNELIASLTAASLSDDIFHDIGFQQAVMLNVLIDTAQDLLPLIAKQRVIFMIKHLLDQCGDLQSEDVREEVLKILVRFLPAYSDVYGEHWTAMTRLILETWSRESTIPSAAQNTNLYCALKLYAALKKLAEQEDVNEDLVEALQENAVKIDNAVVNLLQSASEASTNLDQPTEMKNELLSRLVQSRSTDLHMNTTNIFGLLSTTSIPIQEAGFTLLHRQIPKLQEQVSIDAALDGKTAKLPDEILSLILEVPSLALGESRHSLQSYLRSWRLLFDFFEGSSFKVKTDYIDQLREGRYLAGLLSLIFDILGINRGKPADISAFDVAHYSSELEADPKRDEVWLVAHLYYLSLLHLPSLVKSFVLEIRSRQIPATLETWTSKHISPLLIGSTLEAVSQWNEKSVESDPEYESMTVKVANKSKEINVSYVVDEQTMAIKVVLPDAYPLASAQVVGISRVAVKEEKWQSWLRNCQGVITFSNGSITDGLATWSRNVTGALKGQTECAICYSIISADKQLPTKKCPTCKNLFHSSCLFKWFKTSGASTCPLCRNSFNFN